MKIEINKNVFTAFPELESERILFRKILLSDAEAIYFIRSNDEVMKFMDTNKMESINDAEKMIRSAEESFNNETGLNWGIVEKRTNSFIGYFGFWRILYEHCRAEIGYALNPQYWGKGYMNETLETMMKFGLKSMRLHSVEANVNPGNDKSIKLLERAGFKREAYFRENFLFNNTFYDSIIYSLLEKALTGI
ncbi:MAG: GNAT family N-acetyltransferase [Ignavibacteria bacterium]|nr:GNAT family N-acetyltransferase [Ignavibacteria bacterium]